MLQQQMLQEAAIVFTLEEADDEAGHAEVLLVVLTKGLLRDACFAEVLLGVSERRRRPHEFPINADQSFAWLSNQRVLSLVFARRQTALFEGLVLGSSIPRYDRDSL